MTIEPYPASGQAACSTALHPIVRVTYAFDAVSTPDNCDRVLIFRCKYSSNRQVVGVIQPGPWHTDVRKRKDFIELVGVFDIGILCEIAWFDFCRVAFAK